LLRNCDIIKTNTMGDAMRIISGEARGRKLFAPAGEDTRPTADKIRGSLFNILGARVYDARVLDLFGGTGAMSLEALSRGAEHAVIADVSREAIQAIERNAQAVLKEALSERVRIIRGDYRSVIGSLGGLSFDLVFLDPPYRMLDAYADVLTRLKSRGALKPDCVIVLERAREAQVDLPEGFERYDTRQYGATSIDLVREAAQ